MKKTILSALLAMLLCWVLIGCGEEEETTESGWETVKTSLGYMYVSDFPQPPSGTLADYKYNPATMSTTQELIVVWKDMDATDFASYKQTVASYSGPNASVSARRNWTSSTEGDNDFVKMLTNISGLPEGKTGLMVTGTYFIEEITVNASKELTIDNDCTVIFFTLY